MLDDQNTPDMSVPEQAATPGPRRDVPRSQDATSDGHGSTVWGIHCDGARRLNYRDYYWMMSLADFLAWIQKDDGSDPPISFSQT
ncbi:hypothetical protein NG701_16700 [Pseudarthrobacter sp. HLT3-5]|uniref:hypothetical protein n=1 Tax=Pseudarthrobacter cellobiosi TaxID=2953654 RepID=UPI00208FBE5B|nr:hypothetical protein [Pseudarthrobacter sp. HLT3-5]MCO4276042.1 hypothetical protein [Pseudarthrobacter sp. HLT3-5]